MNPRINAARNFIGEEARTLILQLMKVDLRKKKAQLKKMKIKPGQRVGDFEMFQDRVRERIQLLERMTLLLGGELE